MLYLFKKQNKTTTTKTKQSKDPDKLIDVNSKPFSEDSNPVDQLSRVHTDMGVQKPQVPDTH